MIRKVIVAFFFLISTQAEAQIFFQKEFGASGSVGFAAQSMQLIARSEFVVCGTMGNQFSTSPCLIKLDSLGNVIWNKIYDAGFNYFNAEYAEQTNDGGAIITGHIDSGDKLFLLKTDVDGNVVWCKNYSGPMNQATGNHAIQTNDGGYLIVGEMPDYGQYTGDILIKTDSSGNILWGKSFGQVTTYRIQETNNGGFAIEGYAYSIPFQKFIINADANGNIIWYKIYNSPSNTGSAFSFCQTRDGGFVIADKIDGFGAGATDICLIKTDSNGAVEWSKAYGGALDDHATSVQQTFDGGYIVTGTTYSFGSNFTYDLYVLKLDTTGNIIWNKTFGDGFHHEVGPYGITSVEQTPDSGFIIVATTDSLPSQGFTKIYLVKTDAHGFSGCNESTPLSIVTPLLVQETDTNITKNPPPIVTAVSTVNVSNSGQISTLCESIGISEEMPRNTISLFPNPFHSKATFKAIRPANGIDMINSRLKIYNYLGVLVREERILNDTSGTDQDYILYRGDLNDGMYFYELTTKEYELLGNGKFIID